MVLTDKMLLFQGFTLGKNMKKLLLISLILATTNLFAQSAAVTLSVTNKVIAKMKKVERSITRGSALTVGDSVITAPSALATLKYTNGTVVDLGERSSYQILSYQPKQSDITIKAELYSGKLHSKTSGRLKETLKTPVVALSILGTDYNVYVANRSTVYVKVNQGQVMARGKIIRAGESYVITPTKMYKTPFPAEGYVNYRSAGMNNQGGMASGPNQGGGPGGSSPQAGGPVGSTSASRLAQTSCNGAQCDDPNCRIDLITRDNIDVVDTSLMIAVTTNSIAGFMGLIS